MGCLQNQLSLPPGEELYVIIVADDVRQIQTLPFPFACASTTVLRTRIVQLPAYQLQSLSTDQWI
jgi:hypothetical protein